MAWKHPEITTAVHAIAKCKYCKINDETFKGEVLWITIIIILYGK